MRPAWPPPVRPGDRVGVAALSGPVDPERLEAGIETLRRLGFEPVVAANLGARSRLFAGADDERLAAFHRLAADPSLTAVFFARGGHGALRLLDRLDWDLLARHPRAYVGYSDLTPFLNLVVHRLGLCAFHGPMPAVEMAADLTAEEAVSLLAALGGERPAVLPVEPVLPWTTGPVEGPLLGGCLSLLTATLGTDLAVPLDGSILFWEEVDEPLYRLDRMLTHLRLSGSLTALRGMVVGRVEAADDEPAEDPSPMAGGLAETLAEWAAGVEWPIASRLDSGHCRPNLTLPLGARARLDPARGVLQVGLPAEQRDADE